MKLGHLRWLTVIGVLSSGCAHLIQMQPRIPPGGRGVAVTVDPGDAKDIVVASESGGLFRSTDTGASWKQTSGNGTFWFGDVVHLPGNADMIVAASRFDTHMTSAAGIWRSTDGGASWSHVAVTPPVAGCDFYARALATETGHTRVWAGTSCGVAFSDDSGATWQFLPTAPGYANDEVYAIQAPTASRLVILTKTGVKVTANSGASWSSSQSGLPTYFIVGDHNQIAVSPLDPSHLYWAFNYWFWDTTANEWQGHVALFRSWDGGASWGAILDKNGLNRGPFVKVSKAQQNVYDLHFSDGACTLEHATVTHGTPPTISAWTTSAFDHCDPADLSFDPSNGRTPLLMVSDGGVHKTTDGGASWTLSGAGDQGYGALQMTEVTGQLHADRQASDLYFGTQDNDIWASPDGGGTWTTKRCCEGFYLNIWRDYLPPADTKLSGVSCGGCGNFISGPLFAGQTGFPNPPNVAGNPRLLKPAAYIINTEVPGLTGTIVQLTTDTGATWAPKYGYPERALDLSRVGGPVADPVVYTPIKVPGATPSGNEIVGIKRISGVLGTGAPLVSNVSGIGSLGIFPTMFAWYKVLGVDPRDPNYLIAPDVVDNTVKVSTDAGATWTTDSNLANAVTHNGAFKLSWGRFSQISSFGFDPECPGHIMVGTQQAGIVETFDRGATWKAVEASDLIPSVSGFYFQANPYVIISSYGRGLWRYQYSCAVQKSAPVKTVAMAEPTIYWKGARVPLSQIHDPEVCPVCGYFLTTGGDVVDVTVDPTTGVLSEVVLDGGRIQGFTFERKPVEPPFAIKQARTLGKFGGDAGLLDLLRAGNQVKGLYLDGQVLRGYILAQAEVRPEQLPRKAAPLPHITVDVPKATREGRMPGVVVRGTGFDPRAPLAISVDGKALKLEQSPRIDERGNFSVAIPPLVGIGGHTVLVEQRTAGSVLRDATTFVITPQDYERERR